MVEAELPEATVAEMLSGQTAMPVPWAAAQARLDGRDPEVAAVILVVKRKARRRRRLGLVARGSGAARSRAN